MRTTSFNNSAFSAHANTSPERTPPFLQHPRPPLCHHPSQLTLPIQMGIQKRFHNPIWHCPPQRKEAMAEGTHYHLVLPLPQWQSFTHHQPSARHHFATPFPTASRPAVHSTTLAPLPLLPYTHTHRPISPYTRPTMTWLASSTQSPNTVLLMPSIL